MPKPATTNTNTASMDTVVEKPTKTPISSDTQVVQVVAAELDRAMEAVASGVPHGAIPDDLLSSTLAEATLPGGRLAQ